MTEEEEEEAIISKSDQRTLYLVNIFIVHTARFLNRFSFLCEEKLATVHRKILRLDASLALLEAQLRSIDGIQEEHVTEEHTHTLLQDQDDDAAAAGPSSSIESSDFSLSTNAQRKSSTLSINPEGPSKKPPIVPLQHVVHMM
ncbi:WASH complex [Macleaya cordata]|uniref:WASH complex n=1 Tax=Macleaya cordata TaxID=56857 RepID=A0A200PXW7_MACCD|nr:WASH complex [Macleaya cordata]